MKVYMESFRSLDMNIVLTSAKSFRSTARARRSQPVEGSFLGINKKSFYILYLMFMRSEIIFSYKLDESFGEKDTVER